MSGLGAETEVVFVHFLLKENEPKETSRHLNSPLFIAGLIPSGNIDIGKSGPHVWTVHGAQSQSNKGQARDSAGRAWLDGRMLGLEIAGYGL
jgi:hypothetical protein